MTTETQVATQTRKVLRTYTASSTRTATDEQRRAYQQIVEREGNLPTALQPVPLQPVPGAYSFSPKDLIAQMSTSFKLRNPAQSVEGMLVAVGLGSCLHPLLREGDVQFADPTCLPQSGDLVDVLLGVDLWATLHPDAYGQRPRPFVSKVLHEVGGVYHLVYNRGSFLLEGHSITGVVRRVVRDGVRIFE